VSGERCYVFYASTVARVAMPALAVSEVAKLLHEFGQRTAFRGGNPYRARAYTRAAENLLALTEPLEDIVAQNRLREIPGVGDAIADIVAKLHRTGRHGRYASGEAVVVPRGLTLSLIVVLILLFTGWKGWKLVYLHRVGVLDKNSNAVEAAARARVRG
jgi:DNA polymerase/3'-5' exonuclease PolX